MAQLLDILAALQAERAALLECIFFGEAVWTPRGWGGEMFPRGKARVNLLDYHICSTRNAVEQERREVHPVRPQQQQPQQMARYERNGGLNEEEGEFSRDVVPATARSQRRQV